MPDRVLPRRELFFVVGKAMHGENGGNKVKSVDNDSLIHLPTHYKFADATQC